MLSYATTPNATTCGEFAQMDRFEYPFGPESTLGVG